MRSLGPICHTDLTKTDIKGSMEVRKCLGRVPLEVWKSPERSQLQAFGALGTVQVWQAQAQGPCESYVWLWQAKGPYSSRGRERVPVRLEQAQGPWEGLNLTETCPGSLKCFSLAWTIPGPVRQPRVWLRQVQGPCMFVPDFPEPVTYMLRVNIFPSLA